MTALLICLCQVFSSCCAVLAFCLPLRPRPHLPLHLLGSGLAILVFSLGSLYVLTPNPPHWMVQIFGLFALEALLLGALIHTCVQLNWTDSFYCGVWCVLSSRALYEIGCLVLWLAESQGLLAIPLTAAQSCLWQLFIAAFGFLLIYLTLARSMPYNDGAYHAGPRQVASAALFGAAFMLQAAVLDGSSDDMLPSSLVITVLLCQFYFLTLLYLQTELFKKSAMQKEMDTLNLLYERQRQQYQVARQNVQIINRRCHELKVRIAELRHLSPAQVSAESLDEAERTARLYDAGANTGNEVLDIVLTEKTLLCQSRKIQLNAVADGSHLGRFEAGDLYALFANTLDHAIESALCAQQPHLRIIDLLVCVRQNFVVITVTSPARPPRPTPSRTEAIELRVVRRIVQKYHGTQTTDSENGFFSVKIIFPLEAEC